MSTDFIPVLLGADLNCYNLARAFYEAYGILSEAFGRYEISVTKYSKFINFHIAEDLAENLPQILSDFADNNPRKKLLLMGCTDDYVALIIKKRSEISDRFLTPYIDEDLYTELEDKLCFYKMCDKFGIPYPKTYDFGADFTDSDLSDENINISYPLILKPANSVKYWHSPFDGMKKVYKPKSAEEAVKIAREIFDAGYTGRILLQDFVPGGDSEMRVLTTYSGRDGHVAMSCLGHVLLEEHTPKGIGNHTAIISERDTELTTRFTEMLNSIGYRGFANFDIKYDSRDGIMRAFEINLRQGRSNYYVTAAAINIAEVVTNDIINEASLIYTDKYDEVLWHAVPKSTVLKYLPNGELKQKVKSLIKQKKSKSSLLYPHDLKWNPRRLFMVLAHLHNQKKKFRKYSVENNY
jgi:D-aspartate ligase